MRTVLTFSLTPRLQNRLQSRLLPRIAPGVAPQIGPRVTPRTAPARWWRHAAALSSLLLLVLGLSPALAAAAGTQPMCALITPQEVIALAPFRIPLVRSGAWPTKNAPGGCRYEFESPDRSEIAGIAIGVTSLGTPANALAHFDVTASNYRDLWQKDPQRLAALGDKAWFGGEDETGLKIVQGRLVADINMRGQFPEVTAEAKKQSSIALGRLLLTRLERLQLQ